MTTSGSGLSVVGGTNALKTLFLVDTVASVAALGRVWPNEVGRMYITGRRNDLLAGLKPCWGDVMWYNDGTDGTGGTDGTADDDDGARARAVAIG